MRYENKGSYLAPYTKRYVRCNGKVYGNPTPEQFIAAGILEKAADYDDAPEEREGYYCTVKPVRGSDDLWHKEVEYFPIEPEDAEMEGGEE